MENNVQNHEPGTQSARGSPSRIDGRNVQIGDDDELGCFVFRTTGFNSNRTLSARLQYFFSVSAGQLSTLPLELRLRGMSTSQSHRAPIYYVDLAVRTGATLTVSQFVVKSKFEKYCLDQSA